MNIEEIKAQPDHMSEENLRFCDFSNKCASFDIKKTLSVPHNKVCGLFSGFLDDPKFKIPKLLPYSKEYGFKFMDITKCDYEFHRKCLTAMDYYRSYIKHTRLKEEKKS